MREYMRSNLLVSAVLFGDASLPMFLTSTDYTDEYQEFLLLFLVFLVGTQNSKEAVVTY